MHRVLSVARSATGRAWTPRLGADAERTATALAQRFQLPELLARMLAGRGVTLDNAGHEIAPTIRDLLPDPSTMTDCDTLVKMLADAVEARHSIAIFSDYDVDGATSAAVVVRALRALGAEPTVTVPDRVTEGYGPSVAAMDAFSERGADLVLMLDCGAAAHEPIARAKVLGLTVLVIDHHPVDRTADADAVVNPNRPDDLSELGDCAAVGVAFVVMVGLFREMRRRGVTPALNLLDCLDCVALGTVADVVPLSALNRAFVNRGLIALRRRTNPGLAALADVSRIHGPVAAQHLGFALGPRINAGGRIGDAGLGARLLTLDSLDECAAIALRLDELNAARRTMEQDALHEADALADGDQPVVVVSGRWHAGVVGLVAARLKERYQAPAFAIALGDETAVGSGRSIPGVDIGAAIRRAADEGRILKGGGHAMAAGLTVGVSDLDRLREWLVEALAAQVFKARAEASLPVDGVAALSSLNEAFARQIAEQGPWGRGRPKPVLALEAVTVERAVPVGAGDSLRLSLRSADGTRAQAMAFRPNHALRARLLGAQQAGALHLAVEVGHGAFRGEERAELSVVDAADVAEEARKAA